MNFADYFVKGLRNTLRLKKGVNWSVKGTDIPIPTTTVIDTWFVGEFSSAVYEIVAEYGKNDVEHINVKISGRPEQASVTVTGRSNTGRDLVNFNATVDASKVTVTAYPFKEDDNITPLTGVKLTFKVTYFERLTPIYIPTIDGESSSAGGEEGIFKNWKNTNVPDGFITLNNTGEISISNIRLVQVPSQSSLAADFILSKLRFENSDDSVLITTASNTLTFSLNSIANLAISNTFTANTIVVSNFDNTAIGTLIPVAGNFTELSATGTVSAISNNQQISFAPVGSGTIDISPAIPGNINNIVIGNSSPKTAIISELTINSNSTFINNQTVTMSPIGTGTININPANAGSIDNIVMGSISPAAGKFTTITVLNPSTVGNTLITLSQLQAILLGAAV